ncbi:MAG: dTMP kinase [Gemmatimonadota bacterium]
MTFLVIEGVEGAGKSTQMRRLTAWFERLGVPFTAAREPGGTAVGEAIRGVLLEREGLDMAPETELFLMLAARAAFVREVVRPALERGEVVLADRFDLSTYAYQGYGRGLDVEKIRDMNDVATGGLRPDLYLVLDLPVSEGMARQEAEGKEGDRFERSGVAFLERVREGYRALAEEDILAVRVDAIGTEEEVEARLRAILENRFAGTFPDASV